MAERPACIVAIGDAPGFDYRPESGEGLVACRVRPVGDLAGLTQMGVRVREAEPGHAGTLLHYHDTEEEWVWVLAGRGRLKLGPHSIPVWAGHFASFPPAPAPHHFLAEGDEPLIVLEGGERRPDEDWCTYPELGVRSRGGVDDPIDPSGLPAPGGEPGQLVHVNELPERARPHPLTAEAIRHMRAVDSQSGLERQGVTWARVEAGVETTTYHTHDRTDEWVLVLSGELDLRLGDDWHVVREGDFIAHPAGSAAHLMRARSEATYLMGGQSLPDDVCTYPERGMILGPAGFEKIGS